MPSTKLTLPTVFSPLESALSRDLGMMRNRLRHFFEEPLERFYQAPLSTDLFPTPIGWTPMVEAAETKDEFLIKAELPGLKPEDVTVECENGTLTIRGEKLDEKKEKEDDRKYYVWERTYGSFQRSFTFPTPVKEDKIVAEYAIGVLTVHVPKTAEAKVSPRKIPITEKK